MYETTSTQKVGKWTVIRLTFDSLLSVVITLLIMLLNVRKEFFLFCLVLEFVKCCYIVSAFINVCFNNLQI